MRNLLIGGLLLIVAGLANAEDYIPVMDHITHTERLLDETTIGEDLQVSPNVKVEELVKQARQLLAKAKVAYHNGRHYRARRYALGATRIIYEADRIFYKIQ